MPNPIERALERADKIIAADRELLAKPVLNAPALPGWAELTPAYGRDYKSAAEVKAAFLANADFTYATTGQSTNLADGHVWPGTSVLLRYKRLTMVTTLKVTAAQILAAQNGAL